VLSKNISPVRKPDCDDFSAQNPKIALGILLVKRLAGFSFYRLFSPFQRRVANVTFP
jgi:hypothetical protein